MNTKTVQRFSAWKFSKSAPAAQRMWSWPTFYSQRPINKWVNIKCVAYCFTERTNTSTNNFFSSQMGEICIPIQSLQQQVNCDHCEYLCYLRMSDANPVKRKIKRNEMKAEKWEVSSWAPLEKQLSSHSPHVLLVTIITIVTLCLDFTGPSDGRISTEAPSLIIPVFIFGCDDE